MDVASVTLEEVLKAAQIRAASLVPETSGYLTLAIADASARLPFRIEDDMVVLSTEGTVKVMRGTDVVEPEESARVIRDILERLLAHSVGSMQGLSQAARAREESREGVVAVIRDLEAALVPVNRSAARRALARLAREASRARDRGKLERVPTRKRPRSEAPKKAAQAEPPPAAPPAPTLAAAPTPAAAPPPSPLAQTASSDTPVESIDITFTEAPSPVEPVVQAPEPTPTVIATTLGEVEGLLLDRIADDAARRASRVNPEREAAPKRARPGREGYSGNAEKRSVDDLLRSFSVSAYDADASMKTTQHIFLTDLDAAPPDAAKVSAATVDIDRPGPLAAPRRAAPVTKEATPRAALGGRSVALVAVGLVLAGLIGHYAPAWLASSDDPPARSAHD